MTLMSLEPKNLRRLADQGVARGTSSAEQRILDSWERQIAYCQKYCELLSKKDQQFVDDLAGREPTPSRINFEPPQQRIGGDGIKRGERNQAFLGSHKGDEAIRVVLLLAGLIIER
jgi:hypothetical protein